MKAIQLFAALLIGGAFTAASAAAPAPADSAKAEKIYKATCMACHGAGVLGAPKFGDKAAWGPRVAKGKPALYTNALNGFKMMPPRGGNPALKDDEVKAVVDYMIAKSN
ncbi:c-type cytochrome [Rugamonas sp. FT82W]|uniref:C-type cytochrome n=1 Tax=Duganella vulcania TaxID=2692166 RepID=A0A845GD59_9BURK|nr:c-type cytochrome [Duganella vulcania]MYM91500.1 c-type cytochrome [Duganella vulcania]